MKADDVSLESYLEERAQQGHALAKLLKHPKPDQGVVHTPREIAQQPFLWRQTVHLMQQHAGDLRAFLSDAGLYDEHDRPQIVFTGAGTSSHVGLSLSDLFRVRLRADCASWPTTRITARPDTFLVDDRRRVVIHCARSGNSPESRAVLEYALKRHPQSARHVVITCNKDGALAQLAREHPENVYLVALPKATNDEGLAMTSSFTSMVVAGQALTYLSDMDALTDLTGRIAEVCERLIETQTDAIKDLADPALGRAFFLGNNDLVGAATESALKLQELAVGQITAKGENTMAFRHGPISAVNEQTTVVFFLSKNPHARRYEVDVLRQYQDAFAEMGARVIVLCERPPDAALHERVTVVPYDPQGRWDVPALHQVKVSALFGQLLALFSSDVRGLNVDDPSVHKPLYSRTVQGVETYAFTEASALAPAR